MSKIVHNYCRPTDWETIEKLLLDENAAAGPIMLSTRPKEVFRRDIETAIDLSEMGLSYIRKENGLIRIGSMTTLQEIADSELLAGQVGGMICDAARKMARINMRNQAVLGGVLSDFEGSGTLPAVLLVLNAATIIRMGNSIRVESLDSFFENGCLLKKGEIIAGVEFAADQPGVIGVDRVARTPQDIETVLTAAYLERANDQISVIRLAVSGFVVIWIRLKEIESAIQKQAYNPSTIETVAKKINNYTSLKSDFRGSAEYRVGVAPVLIRRAVEIAWKKLG